VVIGVNRADNLPVLNAAVSGAEQISNWLKVEGFEVKVFVDKAHKVEVNNIFAAVAEFVNRGTITQLVIYFSGHGFVTGYSEYWLLSDAPGNPNEAISLMETFQLARQSGIPSVVLISDACRSTSDSLGTTRVRGSLIFPNRRVQSNSVAVVDQFLATRAGDPAWEVPVSESVPSFQGVYTASFLNAFAHPTEDMVETIGGVKVVPNTNLADYLLDDVPKRARAKSIKLEQHPDSLVLSRGKIYIGRAATPAVAAAPRPPQSVVTIADVAKDAIARATGGTSPASVEQRARIESIASETGFSDTKSRILQAPREVHFDTGFSISGAQLMSVSATPGITAVIAYQGDGAGPALVRIGGTGGRLTGSVALQFADGSGTVVAALAGYTGNVVVEKGGVTNVSYDHAQKSEYEREYEREHLDPLRAAVAAAAKFGVFRVENKEEAATLANKIRVGKSYDPTLGIYAAYAYDQAGIHNEVLSVRQIMRSDLQVDIFDVAMLSDDVVDSRLVVPFCPTLSQGWNLLRVKQVSLPPPAAEARNHLRPALWTTFDAQGMAALISSNLWG
jgi:hypothetical protein